MKFHPDRLTVSLLQGKEPKIWWYFQLPHSVMATSSSAEKKLNASAQLPLTSKPLEHIPKSE